MTLRPAAAVLVSGALGCSLVRPVQPDAPLPVAPPPQFVTEPQPAPQRGEPRGPAIENGAPRPPIDNGGGERVSPEGQWWTAFSDPALDALIQEALRHNFTLRDLSGLYHEDLLIPQIPRDLLWPLQIGLPVQLQRSRAGQPQIGGTAAVPKFFLTEGDVGITASYQVDIWGQLEVTKRNFLDLAEIQAQSAEAGAMNTAAQVAQIWFDVLTQRALLEMVQGQIKLNEELAALVKDRFELHLTTRLAVLQQEQVLLNLRAEVPILTERLALLGSQLTSVLGRPPGPYTDLVPEDRRLPQLPPQPFEGRPEDLVKNSPEVRLAQVRVAEVEHRVSMNLSGWLPVFSLFGSAGIQEFDLSNLNNFDRGDSTTSFTNWAIGARLTWPIFDGGQRVTERAQLQLTVKRRNMLYQEAFYEAVRRVQDAHLQEELQARNVQTLRKEVELGKTVLNEARQLYEQGLSDYLAVLTANANLFDLERALILSERLLLSNRIELYRALGGTWSRSIVESSTTEEKPHG